ncbi:MAG: hypothetical protein WC001_03740 [Desulfurivibrionaceae bacterium]
MTRQAIFRTIFSSSANSIIAPHLGKAEQPQAGFSGASSLPKSILDGVVPGNKDKQRFLLRRKKLFPAGRFCRGGENAVNSPVARIGWQRPAIHGIINP